MVFPSQPTSTDTYTKGRRCWFNGGPMTSSNMRVYGMHLSAHGFYHRVFKFNRLSLYPTKFIFLHFHPLEVVYRYGDPQPQVSEN